MKKTLTALLATSLLLTPSVALAKGGQGSVSVFAGGTCDAGVWDLTGQATSSIHSDTPVDVYLDGALIGQPTLVQYAPWHFTGQPKGSKATVDVFVRGGVQELGRYQAATPCV